MLLSLQGRAVTGEIGGFTRKCRISIARSGMVVMRFNHAEWQDFLAVSVGQKQSGIEVMRFGGRQGTAQQMVIAIDRMQRKPFLLIAGALDHNLCLHLLGMA